MLKKERKSFFSSLFKSNKDDCGCGIELVVDDDIKGSNDSPNNKDISCKSNEGDDKVKSDSKVSN